MAYNEAAWLLATSSNPLFRNPGLALDYTGTLISLWPSAVHFDTLAAAHAASGEFKAAVNAQGTAIASTNPHDPRLAEFRRRCVSYSSNEPYIQPRREEREKEASREALTDPTWGELALKDVQASLPDMKALPAACSQHGRT